MTGTLRMSDRQFGSPLQDRRGATSAPVRRTDRVPTEARTVPVRPRPPMVAGRAASGPGVRRCLRNTPAFAPVDCSGTGAGRCPPSVVSNRTSLRSSLGYRFPFLRRRAPGMWSRSSSSARRHKRSRVRSDRCSATLPRRGSSLGKAGTLSSLPSNVAGHPEPTSTKSPSHVLDPAHADAQASARHKPSQRSNRISLVMLARPRPSVKRVGTSSAPSRRRVAVQVARQRNLRQPAP